MTVPDQVLLSGLEEARAAVAAGCRRLAAEGMAVGTAGNVSARVGDLVVVTPSGLSLGAAEPEDMTVVDLAGAVVDGRFGPTSEVDLHLGIYRTSDMLAVAHGHPVASTAVSCTVTEMPALHYTTAALGGPVRVAGYATFGTPELAANVAEAMAGRLAALMANHGSVAVGRTVAEACGRLEHLDWLARLHTQVYGAAAPRVLSEAELQDVVMAAVRRGYGAPRERP